MKLGRVVFTARRYASAVYAVVVCLSVSPSVCSSITSRHSTKTAKHRITKTTSYDSSGTLVFGAKDRNEIRTESPSTWAPNRGELGYN